MSILSPQSSWERCHVWTNCECRRCVSTEQRLGAKAIIRAYPHKQWKLSTVQKICCRVDASGSAVERHAGSGRPKSARTAQNIQHVDELICSQEGESEMHQSTRQIAVELNISATSVRRIAKEDLHLSSFRRVLAQIITDAVRRKRLERATALLCRLKVRDTKRVFFTDEKLLPQPTCQQPKQPKQPRVVEREEGRRQLKSPAGNAGKVHETRHGICWRLLWR